MADTRIVMPSGSPRSGGPSENYVALSAGTVLGRYTITAVLGQGTFGITYLAHDGQLDRGVAIKEFLPTAFASRHPGNVVLPNSTEAAEEFAWGRQRFVDEGRTLASFHSAPGIVKVFDYLESNGTAYIVMELVKGETLERVLAQRTRLTAAEVDGILTPLLDGLTQVHASGFVHRDIKPANLLLDDKGNPTLIDFGAARAAVTGRTSAMTAIYTPGFAAVEQFADGKLGPWTDIYGLAATLYVAIAGKKPPSAIDRTLNDTIEPLAMLRPEGFSPALLAGVDRGMAVRPNERPQSIAEWRALLWPPAETAAAPPATQRTTRRAAAAAAAAPAEQPAKSRIGLYVAAGVAAVAIAAGAWFALGMLDGHQAEAERQRVAQQQQQQQAEAAARAKAEDVARLKAADEAAARLAARARTEEDARRKAAAEAEETQRRISAEAAAAKAKAEEEARQRVATAEEARRKAEADAAAARARAEEDGRQRAAAEEAQRKAEAEVAAQRAKAEEDARQKAAAEEAQRKADQEARERAAAEEAQRKAQEEALAKDKRSAEAAETALRLNQGDRQRLQIALTAEGFDTRGSDGVLGPRSREMVATWQKARSLPATGFLDAAQQQRLLKDAAAALTRYDEEQKKAEEDKKKAAEEAKKKADEEARQKAAAPQAVAAPRPAEVAAAPAPSNQPPANLPAARWTARQVLMDDPSKAFCRELRLDTLSFDLANDTLTVSNSVGQSAAARVFGDGNFNHPLGSARLQGNVRTREFELVSGDGCRWKVVPGRGRIAPGLN